MDKKHKKRGLWLWRTTDEGIKIGHDVEIFVDELSEKKTKLRIVAPPQLEISRIETNGHKREEF